MSQSGARTTRASGRREVAYPVEHVWLAMATLLPYCSVCDVSAIVDSPGDPGLGTEFRAFSGQFSGPLGSGDIVEGGMPGAIVDWSPRLSVATRLMTGSEDVVVRVDMTSASPDTTLVTISVEMTPLMKGRLAAAMTRSSYARMARRTVESEIEKLPEHLAMLDSADD